MEQYWVTGFIYDRPIDLQSFYSPKAPGSVVF